jgi:hypothetical protein
MESSCVPYDDIVNYIGNGCLGYGWRISDLKIYDKPRELREFKYHCKYEFDDDFKHCDGCDYHYFSNTPSSGREEWCSCDGIKPITRPPQSWCYCNLVLEAPKGNTIIIPKFVFKDEKSEDTK